MSEAFRKNLLVSNQTPLSPMHWAGLVALLIFALTIRCHDLGTYPLKYETWDEYHYLSAGLSLLHDGRPEAWTMLGCYPQCGVTPKQILVPGVDKPLPFVTPAMDHPPLFSLLAAGFARLFASTHQASIPQPDGTTYPIWQIDLASGRLLSILLYAISLLLLFQITRRAFSIPTAFLAALFYATIDHIVFHTRLLVTENLSTPLFLLNIAVLQSYLGARRSRATFGCVTIFACAAALLCKVIAISQAAAIMFLLILCRKWRDLTFPLLGILVGVGLYAAYGWWQGWRVFTTVLMGQSARFDGFGTIVRIIGDPAIVHTRNTNVLLLAGWIALIALAMFHRRARLLIAPQVYLLAFVYFASVSSIYGWHVLPFYPFLCMALAALIARVHRRRRPVEVAALLVLLIPALLDAAAPHIPSPCATYLVGSVLILCAALVLVWPVCAPRHARAITRTAIAIVVALVLLTQTWATWTHQAYIRAPQHQAKAAPTR